MPRFLSDEWVTALDDAAASSPALGGLEVGGDGDTPLVIEHVVTDVPPDLASGTERAFHLMLGPDTARAEPGRASDPTVRFTQSYATAAAISQGRSSAQAAFMAGELRVGGRVDLLLAHHTALAGIDDVFAELRASTEY